MSKTKKAWTRRILIYLLGLFLLAMGIAISVTTNLGISQLNAWPYVISQILKIDMGIVVALTFILFVLLQIAIQRKNFRPVNFLQIPASILFGSFVSLCNELLEPIRLTLYPTRLVCSLLSLAIMAIGVMLYLTANIVPLSAEGVVFAVQEKTGKPFSTVKMGFDIILIILALTTSLIFLHSVVGVREGTLIATLCFGPLVGLFTKLFQPFVHRVCYGESLATQNTPVMDSKIGR